MLRSTSIIIPTFNEAENLSLLCERLGSVAASFNAFELIIVDDNSLDGTKDLLTRLQQSYVWLRFIIRHKSPDLSQSVLEGVMQAKHEVVVVMDADLSHEPEKVPVLVRSLTSKRYDFAIGSRFIKGGAVDAHWPRYRRVNAWGAKILARGLVKTTDPLSGFFAFKKALLSDSEKLSPLGYKIGLELMVKCRCQRVIDVPIHFNDRFRGKSKLGLKQQWQYLLHLFSLYRFKFFQKQKRLNDVAQ